MTTAILIIAKNEAGGIQRVIRSAKRYADEVVVVDGHSTDGTLRLAKKEHVRVISDHGKGRGDGVKTGIAATKGDVIIFLDADGSHNVRDIPRLIRPITQGRADLVIASRRTGGTLDTNRGIDGLIRSFGADLITYLVNLRFTTQLTDILYSFRALRRSHIPVLNLSSDTFAIEQEMVISALRHRLRVLEIPSREFKRAWGTSKLSTLEGVELLARLLWQLWGARKIV